MLFSEIELVRKYNNKYNNAQTSSIEFTLTFAEFKSLFNRRTCVLSGIPLDTSGTNDSFHYPTIDRIDNSIGYVKGNCIVVCHGINKFKGTLENSNNPLNINVLNTFIKNWKKLRVK